MAPRAPTPPVRIGGMLVGYYLICPRKAWLSMHGVWMEQESETVQMGRLLDEAHYKRRDRHLLVEAEAPDGTRLAGRIDGLNLREGVLHEVKKGRACEEAHAWQLRFYLWLLKRAGVARADGRPFSGRLDYPALRRIEPVTLEPEQEIRLGEIVTALRNLSAQPAPPERIPNRRFCTRCAFEELCYA